jgi:hypothetical protein
VTGFSRSTPPLYEPDVTTGSVGEKQREGSSVICERAERSIAEMIGGIHGDSRY